MEVNIVKSSAKLNTSPRISKTLKCIAAVLFLTFMNLQLSVGQIINPYIPSPALDSLYKSMQPLSTLFCHNNKGILERYRDPISKISLINGKFDSLQLNGSQCVFKSQNSELTFQNKAGKEYTIIAEPYSVTIKDEDGITINVLDTIIKNKEQLHFTTFENSDYYMTSSVLKFEEVSLSALCDTNFRRIREIWVHFANYKSLHVKIPLSESMPFNFFSYSDNGLSKYLISTVFNKYGQVDYFQLSNGKKDYRFWINFQPNRFWINFRSKRKAKKISSVEFISISFDEEGNEQYTPYKLYSYKKNGKLKENRLDSNYCE